MTETLAHGYSYDSTERKLSNEFQHCGGGGGGGGLGLTGV